MTENPEGQSNPTLTEDDLRIDNDEFFPDWFMVKTFETKEEAIKCRQQILTALDQYPKLKEANESLSNSLENAVNLFSRTEDENQKLKVENEELKKEENRVRMVEIPKLIYRYEVEVKDLQQENNQLKQLKQRVEKYIEDCKDKRIQILESKTQTFNHIILHGIDMWELTLQQLLKGDSTS